MKSFCKHTAEYFIIGESVFLQDLINGRIGLYNIGINLGQAEFIQIGLERHTGLLLEEPTEILRLKSRNASNFCNRNGFLIVFLNIGDHRT